MMNKTLEILQEVRRKRYHTMERPRLQDARAGRRGVR